MKKYLFFLFLLISIFSFAQETINADSISQDAEFPGGKKALEKFLADNIVLPDACLDHKKYGLVFTRFTVNKDGSISNIEIDSNETSCKEFEHEARRIIQLMPKWNPGKIDGIAVRVSYLLPIEFYPTEADQLITDDLDEIEYEPNWAGIELGICQLMNSDYRSVFNEHPFWENQVQKSWQFNYNFFEYKIPVFKKYLGITTGLGYSLRGIGFNKNYQLSHDSDTVFAINGSQSLKRNKLTCHSFSLPILFEFATKKHTKENFYLSLGIIGSWKFSSYTFQKGTESNGVKYVHYSYSNFNLRKWNLESTIRLGYSYIGAYATYQLSSLFLKDKTVPVYPFRIGVTINIDYYSEW